jgi:hypothetical protein
MPSGVDGRQQGTHARLGLTSPRPVWRGAGAGTRWASGGVGHDSIGAVDHDLGLWTPRPNLSLTTDAERIRQAALADMVAAVERAAADLALAEEPSGFTAALVAGAPSTGPASESPSPSRG